jgi:hypothetical protein
MRLSAFLSIPFLLTFSLHALASVMVLPVEGTNLQPGEADAIGQMVTSAYQIESKDTVLPPATVQKTLDETGAYATAAQKLGASEYIYVTAVRLDQRIVITATRYSPDGKFVHSAKISASSMDDIEPASDRLAKALVNRKTATEARNIDNVTRTEEQQALRTSSQKVAGFKGSFTYPIGYTETLSPQASIALDLRLESRMHFIELGIGLTFAAGDDNPGYGGLWADIGGNLYLSDENTAPYLGGGLMPRLMSENIANLAPYAQVGMMFFRESKTRLYADFRVAQNVLPVGVDSRLAMSSDGFVEVVSKDVWPTELTLSVGMGF